MKKYILQILLILSSFSVSAQEKLNISDISAFAFDFEIINDSLVGDGADILRQRIEQSQFFMLGEQHYSTQISELTNALLPILARSNYKYFAIETGIHSARKLIEEIHINGSLLEFNSSFYKKYNWKPIPFFDGKEDEIFLKTAIHQGFEIWGIDQEYISSQLFLIDEIFNLSSNKEAILDEYYAVKSYLEKEFSILIKDNVSIFENILNSPLLIDFFKKCNNNQQQAIIKDLLASWKIYAASGYTNNMMRMEYMKNVFAKNYKEANMGNVLPKVFFKMGSMHLGHGKNWLGVYDLGNMIYELSQFNNTESISITCFSRYTLEEDNSLDDYILDEDGNTYRPLLDLAKKEKWTVINTSPIRKIVMDRYIEIHENLEKLIFNYDFIIFSPTRTTTTPNYISK
ncbi:MAG: hypothetical protein LBH90_07945 [Tannerella sp.]|jgi:hypothetical protein|nr:hypothetical protein [Tannerella sp.]